MRGQHVGCYVAVCSHHAWSDAETFVQAHAALIATWGGQEDIPHIDMRHVMRSLLHIYVFMCIPSYRLYCMLYAAMHILTCVGVRNATVHRRLQMAPAGNHWFPGGCHTEECSAGAVAGAAQPVVQAPCARRPACSTHQRVPGHGAWRKLLYPSGRIIAVLE